MKGAYPPLPAGYSRDLADVVRAAAACVLLLSGAAVLAGLAACCRLLAAPGT
jgi:hypothetical protein